MPLEIERRFLVTRDEWRQYIVARTFLRQAYLNTDPDRVVRIRLTDDKAHITIKGRTTGCARSEFEYAIAPNDVEALFALCVTPVLEKVRYDVRIGDRLWTVDVFQGRHEGLVLAECEFESVEAAAQAVLPDWAGPEVTHDARYTNAVLAGLSSSA